MVTIDEKKFIKGWASGDANNCLIHTLHQALQTIMGDINADIPWIRRQLLHRFPRSGKDAVTEWNFLDLGEHWKAVIDLIGENVRQQGSDIAAEIRHENFKIFCIEEQNQVLGSVEGIGPKELYILNERHCHFVPLEECNSETP